MKSTNKLIEEKVKEIDEQFLNNEVWLAELKAESYDGDPNFNGLRNKLKTSLNEVIEAREKEIYQELMKVADDGQYEELRREVERYFKEIINKKKETK